MRPRVLCVIGARPEIIQAAPVCAALAPLCDEILVHATIALAALGTGLGLP